MGGTEEGARKVWKKGRKTGEYKEGGVKELVLFGGAGK